MKANYYISSEMNLADAQKRADLRRKAQAPHCPPRYFTVIAQGPKDDSFVVCDFGAAVQNDLTIIADRNSPVC